jgi:hypothetical protein
MPDFKKLVTYSRKTLSSPTKHKEIDGLRKSIAEGERRILKDITNISGDASNPAGRRPSVSLKSPNTSPSQQIALLSINSKDEIISGVLDVESPIVYSQVEEETNGFVIHRDIAEGIKPTKFPSVAKVSVIDRDVVEGINPTKFPSVAKASVIHRDVVESTNTTKFPSVAEISDDIWSPSKMALQSGAPPPKHISVKKPRSYPQIDFPISPHDLDGKVWVRSGLEPLKTTQFPDHFQEL